MRSSVLLTCLLALPSAAFAVPVNYVFSGVFNFEFPDPEGVPFIPPDILGETTSVHGSLSYDHDAALLGSLSSPCCLGQFQVYDSAITSLSLTVDSFDVSTGPLSGLVGDDVLLQQFGWTADLLIFSPLLSEELVGFSVGDWTLDALGLAFNDVAASTGGETLDGGLLPDELRLDDYWFTGMNFDFVNDVTGERRISQYVFTELRIDEPHPAVPEPDTLLLFAAGLLGLGYSTTRGKDRRQAGPGFLVNAAARAPAP